MPVQESSATALVRFTGLGIICFNHDQQRCEIGVIRDNNHKLTIKIQKPVFQEGSESDVVVYEDIAVYENLPKEDVEIEFSVEQPAIAGYEIYQPGEFDRLESTDLNDFRWIVNFDNLHGGSPLQKATAPDRDPLTKIYIPHGLFYTHQLDQKIFFEKVEKDATGGEQQRESFGNIAETIGVKIEGSAVKVAVRIAGKEETHSLERVEGLPYVVRIVNMDPSANAVYSDMPDYYKYFASPSGVQVDLAPVIEDGEQRAKGGAINQDDFCHPITVDFSSIDEL
ncbi:MAG TPA: hypothetical protein VF397_14735 [Pyrinomonadaceae bacterium]